MRRRRLLKVGLGTAAFLAISGSGLALLKPGIGQGRLTQDASIVFRAVAEAVLDKSLPDSPQQRDAYLRAYLERLNATVAAFPSGTQRELSQLLALLVSAPGRTLLTGLTTGWGAASTADIQTALQRMRVSSLNVRQQIYHALRDLTNAAYYADPLAWPLMGYPGPITA